MAGPAAYSLLRLGLIHRDTMNNLRIVGTCNNAAIQHILQTKLAQNIMPNKM